jgi:hypothetical protein
MKLATIALLGIAFLAPFASMQADDKASTDPAGAGQVVLAYNNGGSSTGDICIWYPLFIRDLTLQSLFAAKIGKPLTPSVDKEHAYLIWVSDYSGVQVDSHGVFTLFLIPTGTATIQPRISKGTSRSAKRKQIGSDRFRMLLHLSEDP